MDNGLIRLELSAKTGMMRRRYRWSRPHQYIAAVYQCTSDGQGWRHAEFKPGLFNVKLWTKLDGGQTICDRKRPNWKGRGLTVASTVSRLKPSMSLDCSGKCSPTKFANNLPTSPTQPHLVVAHPSNNHVVWDFTRAQLQKQGSSSKLIKITHLFIWFSAGLHHKCSHTAPVLKI